VGNNLLNSALVTGQNHDAVILTANANPNSGPSVDWSIWHWVDSSSSATDGVQASELTLLGTLSGLTKTQIDGLVNANFHV
jgi:hypothetical protein